VELLKEMWRIVVAHWRRRPVRLAICTNGHEFRTHDREGDPPALCRPCPQCGTRARALNREIEEQSPPLRDEVHREVRRETRRFATWWALLAVVVINILLIAVESTFFLSGWTAFFFSVATSLVVIGVGLPMFKFVIEHYVDRA
jgi:hypothetical protein